MYFDAAVVFVTNSHFYLDWLWPYCALGGLSKGFFSRDVIDGYPSVHVYSSDYRLNILHNFLRIENLPLGFFLLLKMFELSFSR